MTATMATAQSIKGVQTVLGCVLADQHGMTLYAFDEDKGTAISLCTGFCLSLWPPYYAEAGAVADGDWALVEVMNWTVVGLPTMWAYKGLPLYYRSSDKRPGDVTGEGVGGGWHVVPVEAGGGISCD